MREYAQVGSIPTRLRQFLIMPGKNKSKSGFLAGFNAICLAIGLAMFLFFGLGYLSRAIDGVEFLYAKECAEAEKAGGCISFENAKVIKAHSEKQQRITYLYADIERENGDMVRTQLHYIDFWEALKEGDQVRLELWRNTAIGIEKGSQKAPTADSPRFDFSNLEQGDQMFMVFLVFALIAAASSPFVVHYYIQEKK